MKKTLSLIFCLILSACGPSPSGSGTVSGTINPGGPNAPGVHLYQLVVTGDGVNFVGHIFTDLEQANPGPQVIPNGQSITIQAQGNSASDIGVQIVNTPGTQLSSVLYKDGVQIAAGTTLFNPGDHHDFGAQ